jgi:hypothetical protein
LYVKLSPVSIVPGTISVMKKYEKILLGKQWKMIKTAKGKVAPGPESNAMKNYRGTLR